MELDPRDYHYVVRDPVDFNPARNKAIVEETIKEATKYHMNEGRVIENSLGERVEAVSAYACYRFNRGDKGIKDYLGDKLYTRLVGEKILEKIRVAETVNRLNGNNRFKNSILL